MFLIELLHISLFENVFTVRSCVLPQKAAFYRREMPVYAEVQSLLKIMIMIRTKTIKL